MTSQHCKQWRIVSHEATRMWHWRVELTSCRIPQVLQNTIQKIGTGEETNPWSLDNRNKQDEQWQWSQWCQWQWRWALCRPSGDGKTRTATTKTWVWARTTAIASGASTIATAATNASGPSTIAPGATASLSRWCWHPNGQSREKATTTPTTSFQDTEEDADTVSLPMVKPNPQSTHSGQQQQKIRISVRHGSLIGGVGEEWCTTMDAHKKDLTWLIPNRLGCMRDWAIKTVAPWIPVGRSIRSWQRRRWRLDAQSNSKQLDDQFRRQGFR